MKMDKANDYLEQEFPKGKTKFRGQAMVLLALAEIGEKNRIIEKIESIPVTGYKKDEPALILSDFKTRIIKLISQRKE